MDNVKLKKYIGVIVFVLLVIVMIVLSVTKVIVPKINEKTNLENTITEQTGKKQNLEDTKRRIEAKIADMRQAMLSGQKKVYSTIESDLGNDTLFFTLYNDVIEMLHANSIKIKSINYKYNPEKDAFVQAGQDIYFVCDVDMQIVSNYVNLGKFIQAVYQYPYYIRINNIDVHPYDKDKKILITDLGLRLYAHTSPEDTSLLDENAQSDDAKATAEE
ncbi:type 4a pilus biogenesis protein PilO [bacterium]|nr:type 4a pilus biogenesis protein PilO [bacterium]